MENIVTSGKGLESLRIELINNGFGVGESRYPNTLYATKQNGRFQNGLGKIAIEYWPSSDQFLIMGLFFDKLDEVLTYLNS
jgi:hypothetical protein